MSSYNDIEIQACKKIIDWLDINKPHASTIYGCEGVVVSNNITPEMLIDRIKEQIPGFEIKPDETQPLPELSSKFEKPVRLISVSGISGAGKTTSGNILSSYGFKPIAFADSLKDVIAYLFSIPRQDLEGDDHESRLKRLSPLSYAPNYCIKRILQLMGTNVIRYFDDSIWFNHLLKRMDSYKIVVTDARYENEVKFISSLGGKPIRIDREIADLSVPEHSSEAQLPDHLFYKIFTNDETINDLEDKLYLEFVY